MIVALYCTPCTSFISTVSPMKTELILGRLLYVKKKCVYASGYSELIVHTNWQAKLLAR